MFSRMGMRVVAALVVVGLLGGCAEIDRRGGIADQVEDVIFRADTKSHRLLRSYLLVGVLLAVAERQGVSNVDRDNIKGSIASALKVSNEAFNCLYPGTFVAAGQGFESQNVIPEIVLDYSKPDTLSAESYTPPRWCQFFDEKMARLDLAIFRLANITLFSDRSRGHLADIRDKLIGRIPIVTDSVRAAISANKVINQATTIVDDLLNLTLASFGPATALFPLYRDSLELNTWIVIDSLAIHCKQQRTQAAEIAAGSIDMCQTYANAFSTAAYGQAEPAKLRAFIKSVDGLTLMVEAYRPHFYVVSRFIWQSCLSVFIVETECKAILAYAVETKAFLAKNATDPQYGKKFLTSLFPFTQVASTRARPSVLRSAPSAPDPNTTGSIPRSGGTQGMAPAR